MAGMRRVRTAERGRVGEGKEVRGKRDGERGEEKECGREGGSERVTQGWREGGGGKHTGRQKINGRQKVSRQAGKQPSKQTGRHYGQAGCMARCTREPMAGVRGSLLPPGAID